MVDPEIQKAIDIIDQKIASLQAARDILAGPSSVAPVRQVRSNVSVSTLLSTAADAAKAIADAGTRPRKEALAEFLIKNGPMMRVDIVAKAGIPEGSVSYCLSDDRFFRQLPNGNWDVTDFSRNGRKMQSVS